MVGRWRNLASAPLVPPSGSSGAQLVPNISFGNGKLDGESLDVTDGRDDHHETVVGVYSSLPLTTINWKIFPESKFISSQSNRLLASDSEMSPDVHFVCLLPNRTTIKDKRLLFGSHKWLASYQCSFPKAIEFPFIVISFIFPLQRIFFPFTPRRRYTRLWLHKREQPVYLAAIL